LGMLEKRGGCYPVRRRMRERIERLVTRAADNEILAARQATDPGPENTSWNSGHASRGS
jgi:hypothetical protein